MTRERPPKRPRGAATQRRPAGRIGLFAAIAVVLAVVLATMLAAVVVTVRTPGDRTTAVEPELLRLGEARYDAACASCHGASGEGFAQPGVPAPPLDGSAHSWHHSDEQILAWLRDGSSLMPAVARDWTDEEVEAVVAFVKSRWEPWQREAQPGDLGE